ncbi:MAG: hypothetical protein ACJ78Q_12740 [Chloroflexia bacterium]
MQTTKTMISRFGASASVVGGLLWAALFLRTEFNQTNDLSVLGIFLALQVLADLCVLIGFISLHIYLAKHYQDIQKRSVSLIVGWLAFVIGIIGLLLLLLYDLDYLLVSSDVETGIGWGIAGVSYLLGLLFLGLGLVLMGSVCVLAGIRYYWSASLIVMGLALWVFLRSTSYWEDAAFSGTLVWVLFSLGWVYLGYLMIFGRIRKQPSGWQSQPNASQPR